MNYAVIQTGGKQYKVSEGTVLEVDKLPVEAGKEHTFADVLLYVDGDDVQVGQPKLEKVSVVAEVIEQTQGDKVRVAKFKAKARYRKVMGFRAQLTKLKITSISAGKAKAEKKAEK